MIKVNFNVKNATKKVANNMINKDFYAWPPGCLGIFHQPKKPKVVQKK